MDKQHVVIVGAGIVGLAIAYHLVTKGAKVSVVDPDPEGDKASFGNAGGLAVTEIVPASSPRVFWHMFNWMCDPLGPLSIRPGHVPKFIPWLARFARSSTPSEIERIIQALVSLNVRAYNDYLPMLERIGLGSALRQRGALTLYETNAGFKEDAAEWQTKQANGFACEDISGSEARALEPALGPNVSCAVFTPQWSNVSDPKHVVDTLRAWLVGAGVELVRHRARRLIGDPPTLYMANGASLRTDAIVVAAGAWSAQLASSLGDHVLLESERGYNTTIANPGIRLSRQLIFAEHKFVASPLDCGLRIGGAAEFGGLNAPPNYRRSEALLTLARRYLPDLEVGGGTHWAGHRPTTPDSLPVISRSRSSSSVYYAFGHGHLGLTQSATTGQLISDLIFGLRPAVDLSPFTIERFA